MSEDSDDDERVGYRRPPKHSRFKPGQSGNPRGRAKGTRGLKTDLEAELKSKHTIHINKQPVTDTKQRLTIKTLATRAASGDVKAAQLLLPLIVQILGIEDRGSEKRSLSPLDQAILDAALGESAPAEIGDNKEQDDG